MILSDKINNIGFVSTRFAGTDGVSLEAAKWVDVFEKEGFTCFYFAGKLDRPPERSYLSEQAHFKHPDIREIFRKSFGVSLRNPGVTRKIHDVKEVIKDHLYRFIEKFRIDLLVTENSLTIPLNIPLGLAITEVISETGIPTIAHHHDFFWERQEFKTGAVWEYMNMAFPPHIPQIRHVTINSSGCNQLGLRTGISSTIIPNVMDFENPPEDPDDYASDVREALGIEDDEVFILQPTRVVKRKGIEHAIELVSRLDIRAKLVISHASGDEGHDYEARVKAYSKLMGVNTVFVSDIINDKRGLTEDGKKIYTLHDIYPHADFVTYPSNFEGFGNAFLEAVYYRRPIMVNTYSIYRIDIKPKGFSAIEIDGYVTDEAVRRTMEVLSNSELCSRMVEQNYEIARKYYSYSVLYRQLMNLMV
ncbi:MAG: glycosyltransferase family 4 protein [Desulfobacterales bacterium]|nr:glycosyltransferase family 4 protein [Desulfobacterales bacterium]